MAELNEKKTSKLAIITLVLSLAFFVFFFIPSINAYLAMSMDIGLPWAKAIRWESVIKLIRGAQNPFMENVALVFVFAGPISVICAWRAIVQIDRSKGALGGSKVAIAAVIIVLFSMVVLFIINVPIYRYMEKKSILMTSIRRKRNEKVFCAGNVCRRAHLRLLHQEAHCGD